MKRIDAAGKPLISGYLVRRREAQLFVGCAFARGQKRSVLVAVLPLRGHLCGPVAEHHTLEVLGGIAGELHRCRSRVCHRTRSLVVSPTTYANPLVNEVFCVMRAGGSSASSAG